MPRFTYPATAKIDQVDDYHGTLVPDPYRWLEDSDSPATRAWIEAQNELTFGYLASLPERDAIRQRLTQLWDYPKAWAPLKKGDRFFQLRNSGLQNQDVLYVLQSPEAQPRLLLDPNTLSQDGTVALTSWSVSHDGQWLAYATSASGSDWLTWKVRNVETGEDLPDVIEWSKFSEASWKPDQSGFYYARYDAPQEGEEYLTANYAQKLYFHRLGTPQSEDALVYHRPDQKEWGFGAEVTDDGCYLILFVWQGTDTRNRLFYQDLQQGGEVVELISELEASYQFLGNDGPLFYLKTDLSSPCGRVVAVDVTQPQKSNWSTLIPEAEDTLETVKIVDEQFICLYTHDAHHRLLRYTLEGRFLGKINLPTLGSINTTPNWGFNGGRKDRELFYAFQSFIHPTTIYRYDFLNGESETIFAPPIQFDFTPYVTRQVFATSKDGTRVPMFLVHRSDLPSTPQPTLLYGYGGFNISLLPTFAISRLVWLERGGVLAVANLRGGNEYGEDWHLAGTKERKQNVFDDCIACAEYLIEQGVASPQTLAVQGGSNGGLLVGACITQRPDLFAAAQPAVGVMDMLRFHKFTIGWAWVSDYGSAEDPLAFPYLYAYSPLHNIRAGISYPATLITTADHDDRVVPGHSFKFAATLQAAQAGDAPALIRIQTKAGHGFGKPTSILIEEQADIWAFLFDQCRA
ncbi:MAG: S9 family peptidase [Anaerolineales bacterium]|nr:S9 family peptidase [Anaerolineales bacterium]